MTLSDKRDLRRFTARDYTVDPARNTVIGPSGEIHLEPKVMSVLVMLARRRETVVSRSELIDRVWGVEHGADESLTRAISQLRKTFDDSRGDPTFIETIPKRGYRFVARVEIVFEANEHASASLPENAAALQYPEASARARKFSLKLLGALSGGAILFLIFLLLALRPPAATETVSRSPASPREASNDDTRQSVAVLPFFNIAKTAEDEFFADGLTEEIINALGTLPDLLVTARTSAFYYKGKAAPIEEIAKALGVKYIVEGSVRREGNRVRITAQLIRASDGFHLWSDSYDRNLDHVFEVQMDISQKVAEALGVFLDDAKRDSMAAVGVKKVEAFVAYQRGLSLYNQAHLIGPRNATLVLANAEFDKALSIEPEIADAYFRKIDLYGHILADRAIGVGLSSPNNIPIETEEAQRELREGVATAYKYAHDRVHQTVVRASQVFYSSDWSGFNSILGEVYATAPVCRYARPAEEDGINYGWAREVYEQAIKQLQCDPFGLFAEDASQSALVLGWRDEALRIIEEHERSVGATRDLSKIKLDVYLSSKDFEAAKRQLYSSTFLDKFDELRVAAATGCADEWAPKCAEWRRRLMNDEIERFDHAIFVAAMLGERDDANDIASRIDSRAMGPVRLHWLAKWCLCGAAFDLHATPNFAQRLSEGEIPWPPPSPIEWPLKNW